MNSFGVSLPFNQASPSCKDFNGKIQVQLPKTSECVLFCHHSAACQIIFGFVHLSNFHPSLRSILPNSFKMVIGFTEQRVIKHQREHWRKEDVILLSFYQSREHAGYQKEIYVIYSSIVQGRASCFMQVEAARACGTKILLHSLKQTIKH